jgi:hypothetical protein
MRELREDEELYDLEEVLYTIQDVVRLDDTGVFLKDNLDNNSAIVRDVDAESPTEENIRSERTRFINSVSP